jgi:hypothetical protein
MHDVEEAATSAFLVNKGEAVTGVPVGPARGGSNGPFPGPHRLRA